MLLSYYICDREGRELGLEGGIMVWVCICEGYVLVEHAPNNVLAEPSSASEAMDGAGASGVGGVGHVVRACLTG